MPAALTRPPKPGAGGGGGAPGGGGGGGTPAAEGGAGAAGTGAETDTNLKTSVKYEATHFTRKSHQQEIYCL